MLNSKFHNSSAQGKNSTNIATLTTNQYIDIFLIMFLAVGFVCYGGAVHSIKSLFYAKRQVYVDNYLRGSNAVNSENMTGVESHDTDSEESVISPRDNHT
jgi:hypothetical protein